MGEFYCPLHIYVGLDALNVLKGYSAKAALLVTDRFFSENGVAKAVAARLPGCRVEIFDRVTPDPTAALAAGGAAVCRRLKPELLIALGGGSPMDCAKAIRMASEMPMTFVAIPTTSGSGAEVTSFSILTHQGVKHPLVDPALRPDVAILDPMFLEALPPKLIADTGMDLLAHCVEAVAATGATAFSDALAHGAASLAFQSLERSYRGDTSVRLSLHQAATMAGMAFDSAGLGILHALAHSLGGALHLPHGRLCAMLLPAVLPVNAPKATAAYARLARACGVTAASDHLALRGLSSAIVRLRRALDLPGTLWEAGVDRADYQKKREDILRAAQADPCCQTNPVPVTARELQQVMKAVAP